MEQAIIDQTIKALERNHFEVYLANDRQKARDIFFQEIFDKNKTDHYFMGRFRNDESHGHPFRDQTTTGLYPYPNFPRRLQPGPKTYWRRQALLADLFVTGTNALTRQGQLVNVDMVG